MDMTDRPCNHSCIVRVMDFAEYVQMIPVRRCRWWHKLARWLRPQVPHVYCGKCGERLRHLDTRYYK